MNGKRYTAEVLRTYAGAKTKEAMVILGSFGLAGESGEVIDALKKWLFQGHDLNQQDLLNELGDVVWYLALLCLAFGYTLDDAIAANVEKLRKRYPDGFSSERSKERA